MRTPLLALAACLIAAPAPAQDDTHRDAAEAAFAKGRALYNGGTPKAALPHYDEALRRSDRAWAKTPENRNAFQASVWRAIGWCHARRGDAAAFLTSARQAWTLILAIDGNLAEEAFVQDALYECLERIAGPPARIALLESWRDGLEGLLPNPVPAGRAVYQRLQKQVGQAWHEIAFVQQRAKDYLAAKETLRRAIAYRYAIADVLGTAWSAQNRFWVLLQLEQDGEAATQAAYTVELIRRGAGLEVEASLVGNLTARIAQRVEAKQHQAAAALLAALRKSRQFAAAGLTTFTVGRALQLELTLLGEIADTPAARLAEIARALIEATEAESQPAWLILGNLLLAELELDGKTNGDARRARPLAENAVRAAAALGDSDARSRARLILARALEAAGDVAAAEKEIRRVFVDSGEVGADPYWRERARRAGAAVADRAKNAEWQKLYAFTVIPPRQKPVPGHTWIGIDLPKFWNAVGRLTGDGPILTITRRGSHLLLRSAFVPGTQAIEFGWRLRYVNANGILLAIQGPTVAIVGRRNQPTAPPAKGGTPKKADGGADLELLRGPRLPAFAAQMTIPDGETAFVNRFLRVHR